MHSTGGKTRCLIANPHAAKLRRAGRNLRRLSGTLQGKAEWFAPDSLAELQVDCGRIRAIDPDTVIIAGGDGTIMRSISSLERAYAPLALPRLVLLPLGTFNTTTRRCCGTADPWSLLDRYLTDSGRFVRQPFLQVAVDGVVHRAATLGTGLVSHFFDEYAATEQRGVRRALLIFCQVFFGSMVGHPFARRILAPVSGELTFDDQVAALRAFTLLVCSVFENVGLGLRPTYRARQQAGKVHLVATALQANRLGPQAWRVFLGRPLCAADLVDRLVERFGLEFEAPTRVVLDGDTLRARVINVQAGADLMVWGPR